MKKNNKYLQKLEMDVIINDLESLAVNLKVKQTIADLKPSNDLEFLDLELTKVEEFLRIITQFDRPGVQIESDLEPIIYRASKGSSLSALELYEVVKLDLTIKSVEHLSETLQKEKMDVPFFNTLIKEITDFSVLANKIKRAIDYDGLIFDDASPKLKQIRLTLKSMDAKIKQRLNEILSRETKKLSEPLIVIRDNAFCLPVRAEYKNTIKGIVHDTSASMQTFYIEPVAVIELGLQKEKLISDELEEINRILGELSNLVGDYYEVLNQDFAIIKEIDFLTAKALLAKKMDAVKPILRMDGHFNLIRARHPLLKVEKVIPNTIGLEKPTIGIIITGPNTGGKTVLLKTVGLLALMTKFGLLIPCDSGSSMMIFDKIFCDIGDDQSISSNLSTFSSHLSSIINIIEHTTSKSLILFDEIGAGTDPTEGSCLAIAILKYLLNKEVSFITTTHYSELKIFGFNERRVMNASMEFDDKTLAPTYHLLLGVTGSSNAFNIAERMGLKKAIIEDAKALVTSNSDENRLMIEEFEKSNLKVKQLESNLISEIAKNQELKNDYEKQLSEFTKNKDLLIKNARLEAEKIIEKTKFEAERMIEKIEETSKNNPKLHDIAALKHEIKEVVIKKEEKITVDPNYVYHLLEDVYVPLYDQYGVIEKISNNKYEVSIGNIVVNLKKDELQPVKSEHVTAQIAKKFGKDNVSKMTKKVSMTLDLRGKRYEEAKDELEAYVDDLVLVGLKQGTIIHGFGTGTIRNLVQNFVKNNHNIKEYRYGGEKEGGLGVTVITLK